MLKNDLVFVVKKLVQKTQQSSVKMCTNLSIFLKYFKCPTTYFKIFPGNIQYFQKQKYFF